MKWRKKGGGIQEARPGVWKDEEGDHNENEVGDGNASY